MPHSNQRNKGNGIVFLKSTILIITAASMVHFNGRAFAQCINSGFHNATVFTTDNSIGQYDFASSTDAQTSNNTRTVASSLISILSANTYYLKATGFNFTIPSYAGICGITVQIENRATGVILTAAVRDNEVKLIKNGTIAGDNKALGTDWGTSDAYENYGSASDTWGLSLSPADVNSGNFGIAVSANIVALIAALPTAQIDHIRMSIDYNPVLPISLLYFKAGRKDNHAMLEWKTTEEEDHGIIELQRSGNNSNWSSIAKFELSSRNHDKLYTYKDKLEEKGEYTYQLKMISASGRTTYSPMRKVFSEGAGISALYPNPSRDYIIVENADDPNAIVITNMFAQQFKIPAEKEGLNATRFNIQSLPKGIYFLRAGNQVLRFQKE